MKLPAEFVDGCNHSLERIVAVADLLQGIGDNLPYLRPRTVADAAGLIAGEAERLLELLNAREATPSQR